jgi:hypothetical protein
MSSDGDVSVDERRGRVLGWLFGIGQMRRLTGMHCLHAAAETFFTVSLAGSIFFSVSPDAARPRVLLFLVVTMAPFIVLVPLIGPVIDRVRGGLPAVLTATFVVRAVLVLLLAQYLRTLLLFPLAFGVLVVAKAYTVCKNALVPVVAGSADDLVSSNARLSRTASIAGTFAAAGAVALFAATSGVWTLRAASGLYMLGAVCAGPLRRVSTRNGRTRSSLVPVFRYDVSGAVWDMTALRAAAGYAAFHFAFSIRAGGQPTWLLGLVILANGVGGFVGTIVAPPLRRRVNEQTMFTIALLGAAGAMTGCGFWFSRTTLITASFLLGLATSIGRRALDATVQRHTPRVIRGQLYARLETRLELAWVAAACVAVASQASTWVGVLGLAGFLLIAAAVHVRRRHIIDLVDQSTAISLPERLLFRSQTLTDLGHHDEAIAVALSAASMFDGQRAVDPELEHFRRLATSNHPPDEPEMQRQANDAISLVRSLIRGRTNNR